MKYEDLAVARLLVRAAYQDRIARIISHLFLTMHPWKKSGTAGEEPVATVLVAQAILPGRRWTCADMRGLP